MRHIFMYINIILFKHHTKNKIIMFIKNRIHYQQDNQLTDKPMTKVTTFVHENRENIKVYKRPSRSTHKHSNAPPAGNT